MEYINEKAKKSEKKSLSTIASANRSYVMWRQ